MARYERANSQRHVENLMRGTSASASAAVYYSRQKGEDEIGGGATMPNNNNAIISCCGRIPFPGSIQMGHAIPCHSHYVYTGQLSTAITIKFLGGNGRQRGKLRRCIKGMRSWLERKGKEGEMQRESWRHCLMQPISVTRILM